MRGEVICVDGAQCFSGGDVINSKTLCCKRTFVGWPDDPYIAFSSGALWGLSRPSHILQENMVRLRAQEAKNMIEASGLHGVVKALHT